MDVNKIIECLRATLQPKQCEEAEQHLNEIHKIIGFTPTLLQLIMSEQLDSPIRQAGVIYLKNMVCQFWEERERANVTDPLPFSVHEQDRQAIRDNIIEAVIQAPEPIRVQLAVCISQMVKADYPGRWPGIAEKVVYYLQSDRHDTWLGALICLHQLIKNFEYKKPEERGTLNEAMKVVLPLIHQRCVQLMPDQSEMAVTLQKLILKCFFALVQFCLPLELVTREIFTHWMELVRQIVDRPIPDEANEADEEERPQLIWWKCKKWAMHILARSFERYGSPGNVVKEYAEFSEWYLKTFSAGILEVLLKQLEQYRHKVYISPRVLQQILDYLNQGVSHAISWKIMKPHIQLLVSDVIFPLMCSNEEDEELWEADPVEYIRIKYDVFEEFFSPVTAAQTLLHSAVSKRKEVLQKTMGFVMSVLVTSPLDPRHKSGALTMIGALADVLITKKIYKDQAETMIVNHVFPEFNSQQGFLRARACWVVHQFAEVKYKNPANLSKVLEMTRLALCNDTELPVRVEAAITIQMLLSAQEAAQDMLRPHIRQIILDLLTIIRETENDDLTSVMQKLVCLYVDEVTPLAVEITRNLAETFAHVLDSDNDGSDKKAISAMGILNTLDTIVTVMENQKDILQQIDGIVLNVIGLILQHDLIDFYEEMLSLVYSLTCTQVTPNMWKAFPIIFQLFEKDNVDYFTDMMPALHNYVTVDPASFLSDTKHMEMVYTMCKSVLHGDAGEDAECHAAKLLEVILLQYKGQVDQVVMMFVELALERLTRKVRTVQLRTMLLQVVVAALFYNPAMLLDNLQKLTLPNTSEAVTGQFITQWLHDADCFEGLHDRKLCALGLCLLMDTPSNRPQPINTVASQILPSLINVFNGLEKAYICRAKEDDSDEEGDDEYEEEELDDEDDHIDDEGKAYMDMIQKVGPRGDADGEESDEEDDDLDGEETALESFETPLDKDECPVDEYQVLKSTLTLIRERDPAWYNALTGHLNEQQQKELQHIFTLADQRRAALESRRIEEGGGYQFTSMQVPTTFNFGNPQ